MRNALLVLIIAAGTSVAFADDAKPQPPAKPAPDALKGPSVPERQVPGVDNGLGTMQGSGDKRDVAREMPIPHREFMKMLEEALGASAPEGVRASADLRAQIEKIASEFSSKQREYMQAHKGEIDKLADKHGPEVRQLAARLANARGVGPAGAAGGGAVRPADRKPEGDKPAGETNDPMKSGGLSEEARAEVIAKLKELQAGAPKQEDARTAIWGLLKAEQKAAVQVKVDAFKARREKEMDDRYKEREKKRLEERGTKREPATPGSATPNSSPADKGRLGLRGEAKPLEPAQRTELMKQLPDDLRGMVEKAPSQMQDRVLTRLKELKPGQQEEFFAMLRERISKEGAGRGDKGKGQKEKPAKKN